MTPNLRSDAVRRRLSPERVATLLASVVVAVGGLGVASTIRASGADAPRPSEAPGSIVAAATAHPFASTANLTLQIHERLAEDRRILEAELASSRLDMSALISTVRRLNTTARLGSDFADALTGIEGSREVGTALGTFYQAVAKSADEALRTSSADQASYRAAAKRLLAAMKPTESLREQLEALIRSTRATPQVAMAPTATPIASAAVASAKPSKSAPPTLVPTEATAKPTARPTATPTARPTATPTPRASTASPSSPTAVGHVKNPGFELAGPAPWALVVDVPAAATLTVDATASPFEGLQSARIDISVPSDARTGISLRQAGIGISQSHRYVCRVALRAGADREVRVRVASASGETYGTRVVTIGPAWQLVEFEFGSFVEDPSAVFEVDLGRSAATTWVDAVQIMDLSVSVP
jgi:hypothetical protein